MAADLPHSGKCPSIFKQVRGHRMAKAAALENAVWDLEAQMRDVPLAQLLGGTHDVINCGVSIGIQPSILRQRLKKSKRNWQPATSVSSSNAEPFWDHPNSSPPSQSESGLKSCSDCDANSAYRIKDMDAIVTLGRVDLMMIEQPLWSDDFLPSTPCCGSPNGNALSVSTRSIHSRRTRLGDRGWSPARSSTASKSAASAVAQAIGGPQRRPRARHSRLVRRHA